MSVLSNKPHPFTCQCVSVLLSKWQFHAVLGQRPETPRKTDPAGVFEIQSQLQNVVGTPLTTNEIVYVGDTNTDMQTANAAGCFAVGVTWGFRPESELRSAGHPPSFTIPMN